MAGGAAGTTNYTSTGTTTGQKFLFPFILVTSLFLLWGLIHNLSPILIPHLKKACQLTDTQSSFIDSAIFLAYFLLALPAGYVMKRFGYKAGIIMGLLLYAVGAFMFIPAANARDYSFFLVALFIIASGLTFLETAANPYVTILGKPETATFRLNLAQCFNGFGAFIGPIIGAQFILSGVEHTKEQLSAMPAPELQQYLAGEAATVKMPYMIIGIVVLLIAVLFIFTKLPDVKEEDTPAAKAVNEGSIFKHKHLIAAIITQFFYVGAQVGVNAFFIRFAKFAGGMPEKEAANLLGAVAGLGFLIGRFVGTFLMGFIKPRILLALYALLNIVLVLIAMNFKGDIAIWAVLAIPFFMSIMFPTIFSLGLTGLGGSHTKLGSSLLVMSIVGGAICPPLMGMISDASNIQMAYLVPLVCFAVVLWFAIKGYKLQKAQ
ncbi:L-fucose:H+ symporter permease [Chitinophaga niabensis]|uniref:MFS transporter, FHS family, L-fucose permease n=1 Tax=Chitinophaga niabensis TaxID=536979 RepID=A0A1N6KGR7_9BACT|nr:L-fucose:H+ symporter permease [Chitinophaga niabensis]SIO55730.1 MFS transporter, FHS family, L-fucose permease [Chitinophaga niabensis]